MIYYDRDYIPTPEPPKPLISPYIIETDSATIPLISNAEYREALTKVSDGLEVWIKTTKTLTISGISFTKFTAKVISLLNKNWGIIVDKGGTFYAIGLASTGNLVVQGVMPAPQ